MTSEENPNPYVSSRLRETDLLTSGQFARRRVLKALWIAFVFAIAYGSYALWEKWYISFGSLLLLVIADDVWTPYSEYLSDWEQQNAYDQGEVEN